MKSRRRRRRTIIASMLVLTTSMAQCAEAQPSPDILWEHALNYGFTITDVAVSPGGAYFACPHNAGVDIRRIVDGNVFVNLAFGDGAVDELCFSPDGKYFAASLPGGTVRVWKVANWTQISPPLLGSGPFAFSPDSTMLAISGVQNIQLRNATNGSLLQSWTNQANIGRVVALEFSPDGTMLASGAGSRGSDTNLTIWSVPSGNLLRTVPTAQTYHVGAITFSPDGLWVATAGGEYDYGPAQLWRVSDWQLMRTFPGFAFSTTFSPDGATLAVIGSDIDFYSVPEGAFIAHYSDSAHGSHLQKAIVFTPDGGSFLRVCYSEIFRARTPFAISRFVRNDGDSKWQLSWVGGQSPFQVQECIDLAKNHWQNLGPPLTNRTIELEPRSSNAFYRVSIPLKE